jgi:carboxylesterase type B
MLLISIVWFLAIDLANASLTESRGFKTTSGIIRGHTSKSYPDVSEFLGIKFGQNTEGPNRFLPPKHYTSAETFVASNFVGKFQHGCHRSYDLTLSRDRTRNLEFVI